MDLYEKIVELARRRGIFWQSYEIYGGVAGFIDLGPLGTLIKRNIETLWREWFILRHQEFIVEIETPIIAPKKVFEASGHLEHFTDPIVECISCHRKFRADTLIEEKLNTNVEGLSNEELEKIIRENDIRCPICNGELGKVKTFNLLFQTIIGPYSENIGFLRPETAQGMFTSFKRVYEAMRNKFPIGIAQIGRVARNEISPRQGMIRLREFTIMEVEFFFNPKKPECPLIDKVRDRKILILPGELKVKGEKPIKITVEEALREKYIINEWLAYFMVQSYDFVNKLGVPYDKQYFEEKLPHERAHYATQTFDQMVKVERWGWIEVSGHAYRTDYDLSRHMKYSGHDLSVFIPYEKPVIKRKLKIAIKEKVLRETFKDKAAKIISTIKSTLPETIANELKTKGYIEVEGEKINSKYISVCEVEEKISGERIVPHVVEPSFGAERLVYVTLEYAYSEREGRVILKLPKRIAPIKVAVFPLVVRSRLPDIAKEIYERLKEMNLTVYYDESGSIGRRYARADEIGVPIAITVDYQTLEDNTVTLRDRDTWKQVRTPIEEVYRKLPLYFEDKIDFFKLGTPYESKSK
ncbi:MAG TPA: glycine--tRNA ligase [Desulfurococcales archaeon]|nr:glycine--tRNA ligase [Desulfurococcales archaeon]